jgi:diguanylate cyclase (GGDEF)-like protein
MNRRISRSTTPANAGKPLLRALGKNSYVQDVVEQCAEELSSVNETLKKELGDVAPAPAVEVALQNSEIIENKVQEAADEMLTVNEALEEEVRERERLELQLIAVRKQEEAARQAAFHDPLTALPNRVLFSDRLEHGLAQARRHGWTLAVMFIDLNEFNSINDAYGHEVGDQVLKTIASRLKNMTRADDTVCRHGGDEFVYLLLEIKSPDDAILVAQKIIRAVSEPCSIATVKLEISPSVSASIGIALYPQNGDTAADLIRNADRAMYRAKRGTLGYAFAR